MKTRILSLLCIALSLLPLAQGCNKTEAPPDNRTAEQKADVEWFNKRAKELNGNFDGLTPEEQQRAIKSSHNSEKDARVGFSMAAKFNK